MIEQDKQYLELRKQRDEAERNQTDCAYRITAYHRMLVNGNPLDEEAYSELLRKMHAEEERCKCWAVQAMALKHKLFEIEQRNRWGS